MDTKKKTVSAKQVMSDIQMGMSDEQLMAKYGLTQRGVEKLISKLMEAGFLKPEEAEKRTISRSEPASRSVKPRSDAAGPQCFDVQAVTGKKGNWRLALYEDKLTMQELEGQGLLEISKADWYEKIQLRGSRLLGRFLVIGAPKSATFAVNKVQLEALEAWIGPPTFETLKRSLRKRFRFCIIVGVAILALSTPLPGDPELGIEPIPFDIIGALLGITLIGLAVLSRYWPRPTILLMDAIWFLALAGTFVVDVYLGDSQWWLLGSMFGLFFAIIAFHEYYRFSGVTCR